MFFCDKRTCLLAKPKAPRGGRWQRLLLQPRQLHHELRGLALDLPRVPRQSCPDGWRAAEPIAAGRRCSEQTCA